MISKNLNIEILAHRGFWKREGEKNTKVAFERAFDNGFGIETDLRDVKGEIIVMEPNESKDFEYLEDGTQNVVVKYPSVNNDKYLS